MYARCTLTRTRRLGNTCEMHTKSTHARCTQKAHEMRARCARAARANLSLLLGGRVSVKLDPHLRRVNSRLQWRELDDDISRRVGRQLAGGDEGEGGLLSRDVLLGLLRGSGRWRIRFCRFGLVVRLNRERVG
eukprot:123773-Pleurochrysis_carterae.AAC.1